MSERNPWLGKKDHSSFLNGSSSGWPNWDTNDSSKCRDRSRPSWEICQDNKGMHKDDAVSKGANRVLDSWSDKKRTEQCHSEISERNPWLRAENYSSSLDNSSRGWSAWDTGDSPKCNKHSGWPSWESSQTNKDLHKDDAISKGAPRVLDSWSDKERTELSNSGISKRNPWLRTENHSSSLDNSSRGWSSWDTGDSPKCNKHSGWPSWESSQGNKDLHKDDASGKGAHRVSDPPPDEQRNPWLRTENHSSSLDNSSRRWSSWDTGDSPKCNKHSGWTSWESSQGNKDLRKDDASGKGAHTVSDSSSDEQRGRGKARKRSRDRGRSRTPKRDKSSWETRSRSRERDYSKSRNGSPFSGLTQASCVSTEKGSGFGMTSRLCRDFGAGKCVRGSRCRFVHHGYLEKREQDHLNNQLAVRSTMTADYGVALQYGDYKRSADSLRDISNCHGKYYEKDESRKNTICCKHFLRGKCYRGASCRYSHHKAVGEDYDKGNKGAVCDKNVKRLAELGGPAAAELGGRSDDNKWEQNFYVWNAPKWDNDVRSLDTGKNSVYSEDEKKLWDGPKWGDEAGFPDESKATGWGDSSARTTKSRNPATADYRTEERNVKGCPEWTEKLSDRSKEIGFSWDGDGVSVVTGKNRACLEEEKKPWNGPTWGNEACFPDKPKATGWGDSSARTTNSHDPANADCRTDESRMKSCPEWSKKLSDRSEKNGPKWDNDVSRLDTRKNKVCTEDEKPWNGPTWGNEASFPDNQKATGWGDSSARTTNTHDPATADYRTDESKVKCCPEWCEEVSDRNNKESPLLDTAKAMEVLEDGEILEDGTMSWNDPNIVADRPPSAGWGNSSLRNKISHVHVAPNEPSPKHVATVKCTDSIMLIEGEEATKEWEDMKLPWIVWGDSAYSPNKPRVAGCGERSTHNKGYHNSLDAKKPSGVDVVKTNNYMEISGKNKVAEKEEYVLSHMNGRKFSDLGCTPSSSRSGTSQNCHAPSGNHSNGLNNFLYTSVKHKVSDLDLRNQMEIQLDKAVKIPENGERQLINLEPSLTPVTENRHPPDTSGEQWKEDHRSTHSARFEAQCNAGESSSDEDTVMKRLFKNALTELVKEILKPTWKKGKMSKEVHNAIVKKVVDKVVSFEAQRNKIPKTQECIEQLLSDTKPCIAYFVKTYIEHFGIQDDLD